MNKGLNPSPLFRGVSPFAQNSQKRGNPKRGSGVTIANQYVTTNTINNNSNHTISSIQILKTN